MRTQVWHYPSRSECQACHTRSQATLLDSIPRIEPPGGLRWDRREPASRVERGGLLCGADHGENQLPSSRQRRMPPPALITASVVSGRQLRPMPSARSDRRWGTGTRGCYPTSESGDPRASWITNQIRKRRGETWLAQLDAAASVRMRGPGQMPPLASSVVDQSAVDLLSAWITNSLSRYQSFASGKSPTLVPRAGPTPVATRIPTATARSIMWNI